MGRIGGVQRPGVLRPGPPHQPEHDHRMPEPGPGQILVYQADSLGHSVDEHQIEEELDERRALVLSGGDRPLRHTGIIKGAALRLAPPRSQPLPSPSRAPPSIRWFAPALLMSLLPSVRKHRHKPRLPVSDGRPMRARDYGEVSPAHPNSRYFNWSGTSL